MSSTLGSHYKFTIFGQSHSPAIGVTIEGIPAGTVIDMERLQAFLERRAPGRNALSTQRREPDVPEFLSGLVGDTACGAPVTAIIRNTSARPSDYDEIRDMPRPGHADYTAHIKYGGHEDVSGGGHFSGRLTAPLCIAGGIALQLLEEKGITVSARAVEIGGRPDHFEETIAAARDAGDSVGGIVECVIKGVPAGIGGPLFDGLEGVIAKAVFGIPAVKGVEFGAGFEAARKKGSENNDGFRFDESGKVVTEKNDAGGILGGISSGMDIVFRAAFKPTPSIALPQHTISWSRRENAEIRVKGRHDPCIVLRAVPVVEAAAAAALIDLML